ncbi:MAG: hypothetical protein WD187_00820 [Candidatus Woykebacteria bacterium]
MPEEPAQNKPTVVYSPLRIDWRNVVAGSVIGVLMLAIITTALYFYDPDATPVPSVEIKTGTNSSQIATPSSEATPSAKTATQSSQTATPSSSN